MTRVETKLIELKDIIKEKRGWAFAEAGKAVAPFGLSDTFRERMMAMVNAYDVCIIEIDRLLNKNKGEILKGINVGS